MINSVCVYCGSSAGDDPSMLAAAGTLGAELAARGMTLVYGGASIGLMGAVADAALAGGGSVVGVIPHHLAGYEIAHQNLTELVLVDDMHQRKSVMAERSDAFMALPGGFGTLEELFEALTWSQLSLHAKPCAVVNINGYFDQLLAFLDHQMESGFVRPAHRDLLLSDDEIPRLVDRLIDHDPERVAKLSGPVLTEPSGC